MREACRASDVWREKMLCVAFLLGRWKNRHTFIFLDEIGLHYFLPGNRQYNNSVYWLTGGITHNVWRKICTIIFYIAYTYPNHWKYKILYIQRLSSAIFLDILNTIFKWIIILHKLVLSIFLHWLSIRPTRLFIVTERSIICSVRVPTVCLSNHTAREFVCMCTIYTSTIKSPSADQSQNKNNKKWHN